ncbi:cytochrome P450 [Streptomyces roseirectus]|uniref:Cytochrome P450 n=1 Tax=Streptomyces roseirectus TaxID=2768066 RepID=A0A7H0IPW8_9ACTN|nr:cytochrome P450 [Streptomyces roseirectus]QNP74834.1 cytochrome P450 [Streptomyces roseirectus]
MTETPYPFGEPERLDLDPRYLALQSDDPVTRVRMPYGSPAWLLTRYEDVKLVLADPRFSRRLASGEDEPRRTPEVIDDGILSMDPPDHTRVRRVVAGAFTIRRAEELRERTRKIADRLVTEFVDRGAPADLLSDFGKPLPIEVIGELLGVPAGERPAFQVNADAFMSDTALSPERGRRHFADIKRQMAELLDHRRRHPADDLLGMMVAAQADGRLTEPELVRMAVFLVIAGYETTARQLANFVYTLLTRDRWADLLADRSLVRGAVEELLRVVPLAAFAQFPRYATEDVELSGVLVRAGERVIPVLAAANLDPRVFTDPHELNFHRDEATHLGFSHGIHRCLGAPLAQMELEVGLTVLLDRLPGLRIAAAPGELRWNTGMRLRGLNSLPVAW